VGVKQGGVAGHDLHVEHARAGGLEYEPVTRLLMYGHDAILLANQKREKTNDHCSFHVCNPPRASAASAFART
jgi:hypothetical protein